MFFSKDPDEELDYTLDWAEKWLPPGDSVVSATWSVPDGIIETKDSTLGDNLATVWLGGGTDGATYAVTCHAVTAQGRKADRTIYVEVDRR